MPKNNKISINQAKMSLLNMKIYIEGMEKDLARKQKSVDILKEKVKFLEFQINEAREARKKDFDPDRWRVKKNGNSRGI
jgi:hypothetical protein